MKPVNTAKHRGIAGIIPGKVNSKIADDVTINAKKGEYIFPDYVVKFIGADKLDQMVMDVQKQLGIPIGTGPKRHDQPDNIGRMDKQKLKGIAGLATGGEVDDSIYGRETALSKPIDDTLQAVSSAASGAAKALPAITEGLADAYSKTLGNNGSAGSGAPTYVSDPYSIAAEPRSSQQLAGSSPASIATPPPLPETKRAPMDFTAATAQAKRGIADTYNNPAPVIAKSTFPDLEKPSRSIADISEFSNGLVARSQTQPVDIDNLISKVNDKNPMPAPLSEYDRAFVGKADISNPSYRNAMATKGVYDDKVKAATAGRNAAQSIITDIIPSDINAQSGIAGHNINLQGTLATQAVNAQRFTNQNQQETEKNRQLGIANIAHSGLLRAQTNLTNEQARNVPDKNTISAETLKARRQDSIIKGMTDLAKTGATEEQVRDHGLMLESQLEGNQFVPGSPAIPGQKKIFSSDIPETPAIPARVIKKPPVKGAIKSPIDGNWYIPDSTRPGKFMLVGF